MTDPGRQLLVERSLCKPEDLSSDPPHPWKSQEMQRALTIPGLGGRDGKILRAHWSVSLAKSGISRVSERKTLDSSPGMGTHDHTNTQTQVYTQKILNIGNCHVCTVMWTVSGAGV